MATLDVLSLAEAKTALSEDTSGSDATLPAVITALSLALDEGCGPIVVRTLTDQVYDGGGSTIRLEQRPITSITSITEYDGITAQVLTVETNASKPDHAYLLDRWSGSVTGLFDGSIERRSGGASVPFAGGKNNVVVTYVAGRFTNTAGVSELFKEAARITLMHWWRSREQGTFELAPEGGDGFEVPRSNFPRFAIPNAAKELLGSEWQGGPVDEDSAGDGPILYAV